MRLKEVAISKIQMDSPFFFRVSATDSEIYDSVKRMGILSPPIAFQEDNHFVPVTGRSRLLAALKAQIDKVPLMIINEFAIEEVWKIAIEDAKTDADLSDFEKAKILKETVFKNPRNEHSIILNSLDLKFDAHQKKYFKKIIDLPNELYLYASRYGLSSKQTKALVQFPVELLDTMVKYAGLLSIRPVEFIQLTGNLFEIHRGQSKSLNALFKEMEFDKILNDTELNRNQKIDKIKVNIRNMRYPLLTELNEKLEQLTKDLPGAIRVKWDKTFESSDLQISIDMKSPNELTSILDMIKAKEFSKTIKNMSDILNQ